MALPRRNRSKGGGIAPDRAQFYDVSHLRDRREMLSPSSKPSNAGEDDMAAELKIESRNQRDRLTETELDSVTAGALSDYANMMQCISNCLRMLADTNKAIVGNIR
jgi:hypothetical protein